MSRRGNPKYTITSKGHDQIRILMNLMDATIFAHDENLGPKDKAFHLSRLWKPEYKTWRFPKNKNLDGNQLFNRLFDPFSLEKTITISPDYFKKIKTILEKEAKTNQHFTPDHKAFIGTLEETFYKKVGRQPGQHEAILKQIHFSTATLEYLVKTKWLLYERIGDLPIKDGQWGFAVGEIEFHHGSKCLEVTMHTKYEGNLRTRIGLGSPDILKQYLYLDLIASDPDEPKIRSNIVLRLSDSVVQNQSVMLGHFTYHSKWYNHLLTKTIVIQKIASIQGDILPIGEYKFPSDEYKMVPKLIRQYLFDRTLVRISLPTGPVNNLDSLDQFMKKSHESKVSPRLKAMVGDYYIYYKVLDSGIITEDELTITYHEEAVKVIGKYRHKSTSTPGVEKNWEGDAYDTETRRGVSIELTNEKSVNSHYDKIEDPILLTFYVPWDITTKHECFPGLVSGLEDATKGPVGYICLLVRQGIEGFEQARDPRVIAFFDKEGITGIAPKIPPVFMLNDLKKK